MKVSEINFSVATRAEVIDQIFSDWIYKKTPELITVLDAASIVRTDRDKFYAEYLKKQNNIFADGYYVYASCKLLNINVPEQVTGYQLSIDILDMAEKNGAKVYFLGASSSVLKNMMQNLSSKYPHLLAVGASDGYFKKDEVDILIRDINAARPNILMIGMGYPRREEFISYAISRIEVGVIIGVGGVFDILGGKTKRAPELFINLRLEWLYRFLLEPRRMFNRVFIDYPYFLLKIFMESLSKRIN